MPSDPNRRIFIAYPWALYDDRDSYKNAYIGLEKALSVKFISRRKELVPVTYLIRLSI